LAAGRVAPEGVITGLLAAFPVAGLGRVAGEKDLPGCRFEGCSTYSGPGGIDVSEAPYKERIHMSCSLCKYYAWAEERDSLHIDDGCVHKSLDVLSRGGRASPA
jgi:hypothetical protein